ncbi:hypothetical protein L1987_34388 [Smallanthus sonchifolius]|uniref:Uncharacterized protein n=1 Tax=Smallanthus sonchifolius TaxID=185202 RepID=A0ACB9HUW0_9ASTR|nr:hypothetical protein L1987_34388 [Smallanthus sonchifolius]
MFLQWIATVVSVALLGLFVVSVDLNILPSVKICVKSKFRGGYISMPSAPPPPLPVSLFCRSHLKAIHESHQFCEILVVY